MLQGTYQAIISTDKKCNFLDIALNHKEHRVDADREVYMFIYSQAIN